VIIAMAVEFAHNAVKVPFLVLFPHKLQPAETVNSPFQSFKDSIYLLINANNALIIAQAVLTAPIAITTVPKTIFTTLQPLNAYQTELKELF